MNFPNSMQKYFIWINVHKYFPFLQAKFLWRSKFAHLAYTQMRIASNANKLFPYWKSSYSRSVLENYSSQNRTVLNSYLSKLCTFFYFIAVQ